jgi:hypothetical protein|tara:strand:+ start:4386 stop:4520 length:135 start_codon:yes stop_codon:yes gene_type:complete
MSVRQLGLPEVKQPVRPIADKTTGHNAHINNHSVNQSTKTVNLY